MFRITRDVFHPVFYPRYTDIFPGHVDVLNFGSLYPMHCDFPFISTNIFSRCNGNSVATIGSGGTSRFRYKHKCENNSNLWTSRDPGIPRERNEDFTNKNIYKYLPKFKENIYTCKQTKKKDFSILLN